MTTSLQIINQEADQQFKAFARKIGLDPQDQWVGGYVDYEWMHNRYIFQLALDNLEGTNVLEFGCNYGATSIILASLGAKVTAVDVNPAYVNLAKANARRYGVQDKIEFLQIDDTSQLPYKDQQFHHITCNSVLEYVPHNQLATVQEEISRLLKPQGLLFILGTSNRLWPREVHSQKLFINYIPRSLDSLIFPNAAPERGVFPWEIIRGFNKTANYENNDIKDAGKVYLQAREKMGNTASRLRLLRTASLLLGSIGLSPGLLTPTISVILKKLASPS